MRRNHVIADARVLQDEFVPRDVVHRDSEIQAMANALQPFVHGGEGSDLFLYGPSGAGKTCTTKHVLEQLKQEVVNLRTGYVNCWENYNRFRVLYKALESAGKTVDVHRQSTPKDELVARLQDMDTRPFILVLDEIDQLEEQAVLYDLYQIPHITMVMIANEEKTFFTQLEDRIRSRLMNARRIKFNQYSHAALTAILADRVDWGLHPNTIQKAEVETVADAAAGDARIAIGILRNAAQIAEEQGLETITAEIVSEAVPAAEQEQHEKDLEKLNEHQRLLYDIIDDAEGDITASTLYDRYDDAADNPKSKRTLRKYLQKMVHYNLIQAHGKKKGRSYTTM